MRNWVPWVETQRTSLGKENEPRSHEYSGSIQTSVSRLWVHSRITWGGVYTPGAQDRT